MKRSKPRSSSTNSRTPRLKAGSRSQLKRMQNVMATALFRPLTSDDRMQPTWVDGGAMSGVAESFIKPNDRLTSFERLEIYNRVYWFRVLDCLYDDYPGLRAVLGEERFMNLITAYLAKYPSASFTLRNLGSRLEKFIREEPKWAAAHQAVALDMVRFEWAQVVAFDDPAKPNITPDDILDAKPEKLRLGLQPYLTLLLLDYAVDEFFIAVKKSESDVLRSEASNIIEAMPKASRRSKKRIRLPKLKRVHLAVHRFDNSLYYKRLEPEAFAILSALRAGKTVANACAIGVRGTKRSGVNWPARIKTWFNDWSSLGWFCRA
ncbi:MAG: DNA-binding domain-containing protein [Verrucomicrobiota bacterium]